eukprot:2056960-Rhodomonas_salina.4
MRDAGAVRLAEVLGECKALAHLDLSRNRIDAEGAGRVAVSLVGSQALAHLDLSDNRIGAEAGLLLRGVLWEGTPRILT